MPNVLQIGSSVDIQAIKAGMEECAASVKSGATGMSADFQALANESRASVTEIAGNWVKAAESSLVLSKAQAEVRSATRAAKDAEDDDSAALARLAIAKRAAAVATEAHSAAIKAATGGVVEEEGALTLLNERLIESAEASELAGAKMAGFAGVASLLGGGLLLGFFAHLEDEVAKNVLELDHLSVKTGIAIQSLAGLQQVTRELGVEFEPVTIGLIKMQRAQQQAIDGNKGAVEGFARLGISVEQLKTLSPEDLFYRVGSAISEMSSTAGAATSAIAIFGRGGAALIPIFKDAGENLRALVEKAGEASGVTEQAAASAREWRADVAELSQMLRSLATEALTPLLVIINAVRLGFETLGAVAASVVRTLIQPFFAVAQGARDLSILLRDTLHGDVAAVERDAGRMKSNWLESWKSAGEDLEGYWKKLAADRDKLFAFTQPKKEAEAGANVPEPSAEKPQDSNLEDIKIKAAEAHALALVEIDRKRFEAEQKEAEEGLRSNGKLTAQFYEDQEKQELAFVQRELVIKQEAISKLRELDKLKKPEERDATLAGQSQAAEDQAAKQRVEVNARANEQMARLNEQRIRAVELVLKQIGEAEKKEADLESQQAKKVLDDREREMRARIRFSEEMADEELRASLKLDDEQLKHHRISAQQWERVEIEAVERWARRKRELLEASLAQEEAINGRETVEYARLKNQEILLEQQAADRIRQIQQQTSDRIGQQMDKAANALTRQLSQIALMHETFAQGMVNVYQEMVTKIIEAIGRWIAEEITAAITHKAIAKEGMLADASSAAASAFRWVMNEVPFPVNAVLAPVAAAGAFAGVMAFGSFEQGGITPGHGPVPILAHGQEMYLGTSLTQRVLNVVDHGVNAMNGGVTASRARGGGHTFHIAPTFIMQGDVSQDKLLQHADFITGIVRSKLNGLG